MRVVRIIAAVLMGLWWIPATSYCILERAGIVQCNDCCTDAADDCSTDGCGVGCNALASTVPKAAASLERVTLALLPDDAVLEKAIALAGQTPCAPRWQVLPNRLELGEFLGRTATPARAPTLV